MFTLRCNSDFVVVGMQDGEEVATVIRVISTLVTVSLTSSWLGTKKLQRLFLFFSHWLSGLIHQLAQMMLATTVSVCWATTDAEGSIKALQFIQLASSNMLAVTNLAICINLALVVSSQRTMSRVKSVSSVPLILSFLALSIGATAAVVPFWEYTVVSGTLFWGTNPENEAEDNWNFVSMFFVEFFVGVSMLVVVILLLAFRFKEIKECWEVHIRIRFYFGLTVIATVVNLALGICGTVYVAQETKSELLLSLNWAFRHIHIALDTLVLYGVLGVTSTEVDERGTRQVKVASAPTGATGGSLDQTPERGDLDQEKLVRAKGYDSLESRTAK